LRKFSSLINRKISDEECSKAFELARKVQLRGSTLSAEIKASPPNSLDMSNLCLGNTSVAEFQAQRNLSELEFADFVRDVLPTARLVAKTYGFKAFAHKSWSLL
jgi:hypothetical protein